MQTVRVDGEGGPRAEAAESTISGPQFAINRMWRASSFGLIFRVMQDSLAAANGPHCGPWMLRST